MKHKTDILLSEFQQYLQEKSLSKNTISLYVYAAARFLKYQKEAPVTKPAVQAYGAKLEKEYRPASVNLYLVALNQFLLWSKREDCCIKIRSSSRRKRVENVLDREEYEKLLKYLQKKDDEKYYAILRTLAGTGIRIGELSYITVETLQDGIAEVHNKGKTREIYMSESLRKELIRYCKRRKITSGPVFLGSRKRPITRGAINQKLLKIAEAAGVDKSKVHPHAFRHLFAKEYMKTYRNIAELSCVLGHESVETTMIYLANSSREYIERVSGLDL